MESDGTNRRCIECHGKFDNNIKLRWYLEPISMENMDAVLLEGFICDECAIINWASDR